MKRLIIATTNTGKVIEIRSALGDVPGWVLDSLPPGLPTIEETGDTFIASAIQKAEHYSRFVDDVTLADDSGLCVEALGGRPGVHSARYAENPPARNRRVLHEMAYSPGRVRDAVCHRCVALAAPRRRIRPASR